MGRLSSRQQRLQQTLDELLEICRQNGIDSYKLRQHVHDMFTHGLHEDSPVYDEMWREADDVSSAGVAAQLASLLEGWGEKKLRKVLSETGGVLDRIVLETSATAEELSRDIGRDRINADGDPV